MDMADQNAEILKLEARIVELEARPAATDLDWLKNSHVWKRAEFAANPTLNRILLAVVLGIFILAVLVMLMPKPHIPV
jgi:hypothetical protein